MWPEILAKCYVVHDKQEWDFLLKKKFMKSIWAIGLSAKSLYRSRAGRWFQ